MEREARNFQEKPLPGTKALYGYYYLIKYSANPMDLIRERMELL
jgi:hypothetical protein